MDENTLSHQKSDKQNLPEITDEQAEQSLDVLYEISRLMNCGITREKLGTCIACDYSNLLFLMQEHDHDAPLSIFKWIAHYLDKIIPQDYKDRIFDIEFFDVN